MGRERSESLFGDSSQPPPSQTQAPRRREIVQTPAEAQEKRKKALKALQDDYIFKNELEDRFEEKVGDVRSEENHGIRRQMNHMQTHVIRQENALLKMANERRKRHYSLNGDVRVFCYVKNHWPKLIVRPLTIRIGDFPIIPSLGPFNGEDETLLEVVFRPITIGIKRKIDPFIYEPQSDTSDKLTVNSDEYKKLAFFCCFKSWNIPFELPLDEEGRLSEGAMEIIDKQMHPILFDTIASEFVKLNDITEKESAVLDQQCDRLFGKNSSGISNPLEGIKLYCEASVFAKEFSLSGRDLDDLPIRVGTMIRHVANKGSEIHSKELDAKHNKQKRAKVIGKRGKR